MPDGTILAVLNSADNTVSLVDPVGLKMTTSYTALTAGDSGCEPQAFGLAAAEPHRVVYDVLCGDTELGGNFHILNLDRLHCRRRRSRLKQRWFEGLLRAEQFDRQWLPVATSGLDGQ